MNTEIKKMEKCDICKKTIESDMTKYIKFVIGFLADDTVTKAAQAVLPFDGDVSRCLHFYRNDSMIKGMGVSLMRMELDRPIFSFGVVLELAESEFGKAGTTISYVSACKKLDEIKAWVETEDFRSQAAEAFNTIINGYFFS